MGASFVTAEPGNAGLSLPTLLMAYRVGSTPRAQTNQPGEPLVPVDQGMVGTTLESLRPRRTKPPSSR
jgi:hypothetical protein